MPGPRVLISRAEEIPGEHWGDYAARVIAAGGEPVPCTLDDWSLADWERGARPTFDALIVTGGVDVDPARYGEAPAAQVTSTNPARDAFEAALLEQALDRDAPLLAICRGHQLLNVLRGGSLLQHLEEREPHRARRGPGGSIDSGWHEVAITSGTLLHTVLGARSVRTNSRHHQAVTLGRVAPGLQVAGVAGEVVEALVAPGQRWAVSVQWHPERDELQPGGQLLFEALVRACR